MMSIEKCRRSAGRGLLGLLAALLYLLVAGLGQDLQMSLRNYAILFRRAHDAGTEPTVPRVTELLADPAFHPLAEWLTQRQVPLDDLQAAVDHSLAQTREAALTAPPSTPSAPPDS